MTYDELVRLALELAKVEESLYYGSPAVKRAGKAMFAAGSDSVSMKLDWESLDRLVEEHPEVILQTPHQETWPWVTVRLEGLRPSLARELVEASWAAAPNPGRRRKLG